MPLPVEKSSLLVFAFYHANTSPALCHVLRLCVTLFWRFDPPKFGVGWISGAPIWGALTLKSADLSSFLALRCSNLGRWGEFRAGPRG